MRISRSCRREQALEAAHARRGELHIPRLVDYRFNLAPRAPQAGSAFLAAARAQDVEVTVMVAFAPDPALGFDPRDPAETPRRLSVVIGDREDCLVVWREYGDAVVTHVVGQGIWENVDTQAVAEALAQITDLPSADPS